MDAHDEPAGRSRQAMFAADHRKAISQSVVWEGMTCSGCCDVVAASRVRRDSGRGNLRVILPRGCQSFGPADYCHSNKCPLGNSAVDKHLDYIGDQFHGQLTLGHAADAPGPGGRGTAGEIARCRAGEGDAPPLTQRLGRPDARARATRVKFRSELFDQTEQSHTTERGTSIKGERGSKLIPQQPCDDAGDQHGKTAD